MVSFHTGKNTLIRMLSPVSLLFPNKGEHIFDQGATSKRLPWQSGLGTLLRTKIKGYRFNPEPITAFFLTLDFKKCNVATSVRVIVICSDHELLWRDSYKGVDCALTSSESAPDDCYYYHSSMTNLNQNEGI